MSSPRYLIYTVISILKVNINKRKNEFQRKGGKPFENRATKGKKKGEGWEGKLVVRMGHWITKVHKFYCQIQWKRALKVNQRVGDK